MYTQEQLEAMSDFEVNKLVAEKEGLSTDSGYGFMDSEGNVVCYDVIGPIDDEPYAVEIRKNYCNSWTDMGTIIMNNQITVYSFVFHWRCHSLLVKDLSVYVDHRNPLRAAAIVYLLMGE